MSVAPPFRNYTKNLPLDLELIWVLTAVAGILLLEAFITIVYLRWHNLSSKTKWRRLREQGVVIVDGPVLIWADNPPPRPTYSNFNLRRAMESNYDSRGTMRHPPNIWQS